MKACNLLKNNMQTRSINVYNFSDYIIRYSGGYYVGGFTSLFCTLPFFLNENIKVTFPDDADFVEFVIQYWIDDLSLWRGSQLFVKSLPGIYCFRASGTLLRPSFSEIACP